MGNVLDCSSDPLDQIHEGPDADAPIDVNAGADDVSVVGVAGGERGQAAAGWETAQQNRIQKPEVLYLEKAVPLRDSIMWKLQRVYYTAHHVQCWEKMVVPCFVTSNSFIAHAYARVLVAYMRDWFLYSNEADMSEPMLIVEIGSGHGKFACLVLQHLLEMREFLPTLPVNPRVKPADRETEVATSGEGAGEAGEEDNASVSSADGTSVDKGARRATSRNRNFDGLPFRYIVTDVAQGTLDYVRSHSSMQEFLDGGLLDLAFLDAEDPSPPSELHFQVSNTTVDLRTRKTPMVAVCNYVFDSLRQDAFRIKEDTLFENRVSITAARPLPEDLSQLSLNALQGLGLQWDHKPYAVSAERAKAFYAGLEKEGTTGASRGGAAEDVMAVSVRDTRVEGGRAREDQSIEAGSPNAGDVDSTAPPSVASPESDGNVRSSVAEGQQLMHGADSSGIIRGQMDGRKSGTGGDNEAVTTEGAVRRDSDFDELLASYLNGSFGASGGSLLIPLGGLRLLRHLSFMAGGRCLVLAGDKGYVNEEEMSGQRDPHIAYHGSLSCMVNLDALARYTCQRGGWAMSSPYMEGFKCQALAFGMEEEALEETRLAFEAATQEFGPESFSTLQRAVKDEVAVPSLSLVTQLLRLSQLDPDVFMKFRVSLVQQVSSHELAPPTWEDLKNDALAIADKWYPLQQGKDVNFEVARLLMALKDFESALELFRRSDRICGEHHVTCHNMGMSYFYLGKLKQAKECFERSLALDETYEDSTQWLTHVRRSMEPHIDLTSPQQSAPTGEGRDRLASSSSSLIGGNDTQAVSIDVSERSCTSAAAATVAVPQPLAA